MPLINLEKYNRTDLPILWKAEEGEEYFSEKVILTNSEKKILKNYGNTQRRKEYYVARHILQNILNISSEILYNHNGKPYLKDSSLNISISHSKDIIGIYTDPGNKNGFDIELIHPKIERIANRFINSSEYEFIHSNDKINSYIIIWCAKETLMKIHGSRKLDFKKNLNILPFKVENDGHLDTQLIIDNETSSFVLEYLKYDDFYIVFGPKQN